MPRDPEGGGAGGVDSISVPTQSAPHVVIGQAHHEDQFGSSERFCLPCPIEPCSMCGYITYLPLFLGGPEGSGANGKTECAGGQGGADRWSVLQQRGFYLSNCYEIILGKVISTKQGTTSGCFDAIERVFSGLPELQQGLHLPAVRWSQEPDSHAKILTQKHTLVFVRLCWISCPTMLEGSQGY